MNNDINLETSDYNPESNGGDSAEEGTDGGAGLYSETMPEENGNGGAFTGAGGPPEQEPEPEKHRFVMPERFSITGMAGAFRDYWNGIKKQTKIAAVSALAGIIVLAVILTAVLGRSPYGITFSGQEDQEVGEILQILQNHSIPYKLDPIYRTISVKEKDKSRALGAVVVENHPQTGIIYEEETSGNMLETSQEQKAREKRNREKKLEAALNTITGVNSSQVTLTIPDNSKNVLIREQIPSSAAIMLKLKPAFKISPEAVRGIENLIQKSVENLLPENITIIDGDGTLLNGDTEETAVNKLATIAEMKDDYERRKERDLYNKALQYLAPVFGIDRFTIMCSVESDFDDLIKEAKDFTGANVDEETGNHSGIISGVASDWMIGSGDPEDIGQAVADLNPQEDGYYESTGDISGGGYSEERHYSDERMVNYVFTQMQKTSPGIKNISIAVIVDADELDEEYEEAFVLNLGMGTGINEVARKTWTDDVDFIDHLRTYISIMPSPFFGVPEPETAGLPADGMRTFQMLLILGAAVIVIIILVICIIAVASRRNRERDESAQREAALLAGEGIGTMMDIDPAVSSLGLAVGKHAAAAELAAEEEVEKSTIEAKEQNLKKQIKLFTEQHPEIAAQLIKTLIKGDEMPNG